MTTPRWLTDPEQDAWQAFLRAGALVDQSLDRQLQRDAGMPHTYYMILARLSDAPNREARMSDLATMTQSSQSRLSHAVAKLEANGWVRRERCATDKRGNNAVLTDAGFAVLAAAAPGHVDQVRKAIFDRLTTEQVAQLTEICRVIGDGIVAGGDADCPTED